MSACTVCGRPDVRSARRPPTAGVCWTRPRDGVWLYPTDRAAQQCAWLGYLRVERERDAARALAARARSVLDLCGRLPDVHSDAADCPCAACVLVREIPKEWES